MQWAKVTQNEAVFKGRSNYTAIDKAVEELLRPRDQLHADVVPGLAGRRPAGAGHVEPGHLRQRGGRSSAAARTAATGAPASPPTSTRSTASTSSTTATTAIIRPTRPATPPAASWACPTAPTRRCPIAAGSRSRSRPLSERGYAIMFRTTLLAASFAAIFGSGAFAAVSADEAKQLGTTLTAVGAEKAGNKDGTIPGVHRRHQAAGRLQGGQRLPPRSVRERKAAPRRSPARTRPRRPTS